MKHSEKQETPSNGPSEPRPSKAYTPKKGRPTPSRKQAERQPGTFESRYTPRESWKESRKKRKELKASMSADEWKAYKQEQKEQRRAHRREAQAAMDRGEERYLLERDRGEHKRFIRDYVDSRRYASNFVMPVALVLLVVMFIGQWAPAFASAVSIGAMLLLFALFIEGIVLGRSVARLTKERFPEVDESNLKLGFYAYSRATQPRRWRTPKPRVELGTKVA